MLPKLIINNTEEYLHFAVIHVRSPRSGQIHDVEIELNEFQVQMAIDDASNTEQMRLLASMYQRLIRHVFPVYLVMTGIAKELQSLQDEKSLTFLTRALKITIETLNVTRIKAKYQEVLKIDCELAEEMAKFV